jgi:hypothetical protein
MLVCTQDLGECVKRFVFNIVRRRAEVFAGVINLLLATAGADALSLTSSTSLPAHQAADGIALGASDSMERISCRLTPAEAGQEGRWHVVGMDGTDRYCSSDEWFVLPGPGTYEVEFDEVVGLLKPANQAVLVAAGESIMVTGVYTRVPSVRIVSPHHDSIFVESETIHFEAQTFLLDSNAIADIQWLQRYWEGPYDLGHGLKVEVPVSTLNRHHWDSDWIYVVATDTAGNAYTSQLVNIHYCADGDTNGLADAWESHYWPSAPSDASHAFMAKRDEERNPYESGGGEFDWDGDGFSNFREWLADTDPTDEQSYFALRGIMDGNGLILQWHVCSNRVYAVYGTDHLKQGFQLLKTMSVGQEPGLHTYRPDHQGDIQFYHVEVTR